MASKQQLIKEVAGEIGWTQADVKRAVDAYGEVSSKEDVLACLIHFAGPELKELRSKLGAQKGLNTKHKQIIDNLLDQLSSVKDFYANKMVPTLRATIAEQANLIKELLQKSSEARGKSGNE